jgi:hypothetical protein
MRKSLGVLILIALVLVALVAVQADFGTNWSAEYFDNPNLQGSPVYTESAPNGINFNWGTGSPNAAVPVDFFSARFTSTQTFNQDWYLFSVTSDDGVRVFIDSVLVLDRFIGRPQTTDTFQREMTAGDHTIVVEYFEGIDLAALQFQYFQINVPSTPVPTTDPCTVRQASYRPADFGTNWSAEFFDNANLQGSPVHTETLSGGVNFNWGTNAPAAGVPADNFSARFTSTQSFNQAWYLFSVTSDDGVRVFIDSVLVLDQFFGRTLTTDTFQRQMTAGDHTIVVEYFDGIDQAALQFQYFQVADPLPTPDPCPPPQPPSTTYIADNLAAQTNGNISAENGTGNIVSGDVVGNTYFRVINQGGDFTTSAAEIGVQSLMDLGVIQAVNLFGMLPNGQVINTFTEPVQVCLNTNGAEAVTVYFLMSGETTPAPQVLAFTQQDEAVCVSIGAAGLVVLTHAAV